MQPRIYGPYQRGDNWRVHVVTGRGRSRKTVYQKFATRERADAWIAGARDEAQGITVKAAVERFIAYQRDRKGNAATTLELYEYRLRAILGLPTNELRPIRWLRGRGVELYAASRVKKDGSPRSADTHLGGLRVGVQFGAWCVAQRILKANPFENVEGEGRLRRGSTKERLRVDEARALRQACHDDGGADGALTLAYLLLGTRASEIVCRVGRDLDDGGRLLWIDRTKTDAGSRHLEIPEELQPLLLELRRGPEDRIFVNKSGNPMTRRVAYQRVTAFVAKVTKREKIGPQALRRTQSTLATDAGATGPMVSAHLGHVVMRGMSSVTRRSYVDPNAVRAAAVDRGLRVINGGA